MFVKLMVSMGRIHSITQSFKKYLDKNKRFVSPLFFVIGFALIGTVTLYRTIATNEVKTVEAENISLSSGAMIIADPSASNGQYVLFDEKIESPSSTPIDENFECNPNRTVLVTDESFQNRNLGFEATNTAATSAERSEIKQKIQKEINTFINRELSRGRMYKKDGKVFLSENNQEFTAYQRIVGKVGIVQTNTERRSQTGWSVKSLGKDLAESHIGRFDPIVAPCKSVFGHEHVFFGNTRVDGFSTTASMFNQKSTLDPIDRQYLNKTYNGEWIADSAAYWMPSAYKNGKRLITQNVTFYYFPTGKSTNPQVHKQVQPIPLGLRMIAGDANYNGNTGSCRALFQQFDDDPNNTCGKTDMITMASNKKLEFTVTFPSCWDGKHLNTPDQSHVAYPKGGKTNTNCPSTHPVMIPQLQMIGNFAEGVGSNDDFELSSGSWKTFHADFWNVWDPTLMQELTESIINQSRSAGGIRAALPN